MRSIRFGLIAIALCGLIALAAGVGIAFWAQHSAVVAAREAFPGSQQLAAMFHDIYAWSSLAVAIVAGLVAAALVSLTISIRQLRDQEQEEAHQAMHDALTGLPNRRYLSDWLKITLAAAQRGGRTLALLYFDLDGFKQINDRFGHEVGDRVLQVTAARLRGALRAADFFARIGGDEFVAVLADTPAGPPVSQIIDRLQRVILRAPVPEVGDGAVRASIGVAWFPADGDTVDALLVAADHAMYEVKKTHHVASSRGAEPAWPREIVTDERRSTG